MLRFLDCPSLPSLPLGWSFPFRTVPRGCDLLRVESRCARARPKYLHPGISRVIVRRLTCCLQCLITRTLGTARGTYFVSTSPVFKCTDSSKFNELQPRLLPARVLVSLALRDIGFFVRLQHSCSQPQRNRKEHPYSNSSLLVLEQSHTQQELSTNVVFSTSSSRSGRG